MASSQVWFWILVAQSLFLFPLPVSSSHSATTFQASPLSTSPALPANNFTDYSTLAVLLTCQPMLIRWSGWWTIVVFTITVKWCWLSSQTWTREATPSLQLRTRGRTLTSAAVSSQGAFGPDGHGWSVTQLPAVAELGAVDAEHVQDSGRCQRRLFPQVQSFPRWVEDPIPTSTRRVGAVERGKSIPIPLLRGSKATRIQSRYQSLLHEGEGLVSSSNKTYPFAPSTEEPSDSNAPPAEQLSLFFVGVNNGVKDPEHDAKAFKTALQVPTTASAAIRFTSLAGADATLGNIKGWLLWLDLQATLNGSKMLVFLSGRGDAANRMCLSADASISESDLCDWLSTTRTRLGLLHSKPVTVVTDICREGKNPPRASPSDVVNLVWSCSLGQRAHAIEFKDPAVPRSCFWLALFRACKDAGSSLAEFKPAFLRRLDELERFQLHSYKVWHQESGFCEYCSDEPGGRCAGPGPQVPDGSAAGWEGIYQLATVITKNYQDSVTKIDTRYLEEMELCRFPVASDPPSVECTGRTTRHTRGASRSVFQA